MILLKVLIKLVDSKLKELEIPQDGALVSAYIDAERIELFHEATDAESDEPCLTVWLSSGEDVNIYQESLESFAQRLIEANEF